MTSSESSGRKAGAARIPPSMKRFQSVKLKPYARVAASDAFEDFFGEYWILNSMKTYLDEISIERFAIPATRPMPDIEKTISLHPTQFEIFPNTFIGFVRQSQEHWPTDKRHVLLVFGSSCVMGVRFIRANKKYWKYGSPDLLNPALKIATTIFTVPDIVFEYLAYDGNSFYEDASVLSMIGVMLEGNVGEYKPRYMMSTFRKLATYKSQQAELLWENNKKDNVSKRWKSILLLGCAPRELYREVEKMLIREERREKMHDEEDPRSLSVLPKIVKLAGIHSLDRIVDVLMKFNSMEKPLSLMTIGTELANIFSATPENVNSAIGSQVTPTTPTSTNERYIKDAVYSETGSLAATSVAGTVKNESSQGRNQMEMSEAKSTVDPQAVKLEFSTTVPSIINTASEMSDLIQVPLINIKPEPLDDYEDQVAILKNSMTFDDEPSNVEPANNCPGSHGYVTPDHEVDGQPVPRNSNDDNVEPMEKRARYTDSSDRHEGDFSSNCSFGRCDISEPVTNRNDSAMGGICAMEAADLCNSLSTSEPIPPVNPENMASCTLQVDADVTRTSEVAAIGILSEGSFQCNSGAVCNESMPKSLCIGHNVPIKLEPCNLPPVVNEEPRACTVARVDTPRMTAENRAPSEANAAEEVAATSIGLNQFDTDTATESSTINLNDTDATSTPVSQSQTELEERVQSKVQCLGYLVQLINHLDARGYEINPPYLDGVLIKRQNT